MAGRLQTLEEQTTMEEARREELEKKLQDLIEQADHQGKRELPPSKTPSVGVKVIRRRKGKRDSRVS